MNHHQFKAPELGVTVSLVMVTPQLAEEWLTKNTHNRNLKTARIALYATDMANGDWLFTGEPIRFSSDGTLVDGQNRLMAIVKSGTTQPTLVVEGIVFAAQAVIDTGASRSLGDALKLIGEPNAIALAAILRRAVCWDDGQRRSLRNSSVSNPAALHYLETHPHIREIVNPARRVSDETGTPGAAMGLCWWVTEQIDSDDAEFFFRRLADGQGLVDGDPIYALRRTLAALNNDKGERSETYILALIFKAWNFYRSGQECFRLFWRRGGANPEQFPEPK